ncbi:MAG: dehydrogenase, partial [Planctomycetota bacterium]
PSIPAARTLPDGFLNTTFRRYGRDIENLAQEVDHALRTPAEDIARQVAQTLDQLPEGDPLRGLQVFRSSKAACSACHQLGYLGGRIGPELTRIGRSRTRSALLEAILFPSSRIEQSFVPMQVLTSDGQVLNGLVVSEDAERIRLQVAADRVETVDRSDILMSRPGTTSIMPGGLQQVLSLQEIADLLALLESSK